MQGQERGDLSWTLKVGESYYCYFKHRQQYLLVTDGSVMGQRVCWASDAGRQLSFIWMQRERR